jgi:hypothetical protein
MSHSPTVALIDLPSAKDAFGEPSRLVLIAEPGASAEIAGGIAAAARPLAERLLDAPSISAAFCIETDHCEESLRWAWRDYAAPLAALLAGPGTRLGAVVRRDALAALAVQLQHPDALWKMLLEFQQQGRNCEVVACQVDADSASGWLPRLVPAPGGRTWLKPHIGSFLAGLRASRAGGEVDRSALAAGIYQWHDLLEDSHREAQSIEGKGALQLGDYWHAIMHRREPDYGNAKYWFRALGRHGLFGKLAELAGDVMTTVAQRTNNAARRWAARLLGARGWDPFAFVDLCEECAGDENSELALAARRIQAIEMSLLMKACARLTGLCEATSR